MSVADRFGAAAASPPLSDLSTAAARELRAVLGAAGCFEDLPGKWQAALLESEARATRVAVTPRCCCGEPPGG